MTQPEALRISDELLALHGPTDIDERAAAELRRLHEAHDWQHKMAGERLRRIEKAEARITELETALRQAVEALKIIAVDVKTTPNAYEATRQAITAAKQALGEA